MCYNAKTYQYEFVNTDLCPKLDQERSDCELITRCNNDTVKQVIQRIICILLVKLQTKNVRTRNQKLIVKMYMSARAPMQVGYQFPLNWKINN